MHKRPLLILSLIACDSNGSSDKGGGPDDTCARGYDEGYATGYSTARAEDQLVIDGLTDRLDAMEERLTTVEADLSSTAETVATDSARIDRVWISH